MGADKQVVIQKRIDEVMNEEFEKIIAESGKDPLLRLIRQGKIDSLTLEEIRAILRGKKNE
jgi:hypothetical protein